jgi:hypothetical protein
MRHRRVRSIFDVMPHPVIEFITDKRFVRRARELRTIEAMLRLYCRGHRHENRAPLCDECAALLEYATRRLERCVFGDAKPTCANCVVHCYSPQMREKVRIAMRWAGPRMLLRHPILGILHKLDGRRPAPLLPAKPAKRHAESAVTKQSDAKGSLQIAK